MANNIQQPTTPRLQALQNLQNQLPVASQKIAQGMQAARNIQLQQAVAKAPTGAAIAPAAQQTAGAITEQAGTQQAQQAQQMVQQAGQVGQLQLGEQQMAAQQKIAGAQQAARQQEIAGAERLGRLDLSAKKELYDSQLQFQKDEAGRTLFNQRQLADYAIQNAKSEEEYKNWAQQAQLLNKRDLQAMETAYDLVVEDLKQKWAIAEQKNDQAAKEDILRTEAAVKAAMEKKRAKAANSAAMWSTGGAIVGAAVGSFAGPTGALIGAQAGAGLGTLAKTAFGG